MDLEKWVDKTFKLRPAKGTNVRHIEFKWNILDDFIYLGTNACCQWHFNRELLSQGVEADISLEGERLDEPVGVTAYLWLPTDDHTAPTLQNIELGILCIDELVRQKRKVYIHCKNGHGRGPTLAVAYYMFKGRSLEDALAFLKEKKNKNHI